MVTPVSHDPSEINLISWFVLKKHFLLLSLLKTIVLLNIFVKTLNYTFIHVAVWKHCNKDLSYCHSVQFDQFAE